MKIDHVNDSLATLHDAHVDHFVVVAAEHDSNDVLSDVVHVTLHCGQHNSAVVFRPAVNSIISQEFFCLHEGSKVAYSSLHDSGGLDDLWEEHLTGAEVVANGLHAVHEGTLDNVKRSWVGETSLLSINIDEIDNSLDERVFQSLVNWEGAPLIYLLRYFNLATASFQFVQLLFLFLGIVDQPLHVVTIVRFVQDHLGQDVSHLHRDVFIDWQFSSVHDSHIHTFIDRVVQKH